MTVARARRAAELARARPQIAVILSGRNGLDEAESARTEAKAMAEVLIDAGVAPERLALEDESRDTLGNALLTAVRYLRGLEPRPLALVTSPFHMPRAEFVFRHVLGPGWLIEPVASEPVEGDDVRATGEPALMQQTRGLLEGTAPGDLRNVATRLRVFTAYYREVERLDPDRLDRDRV